MTKKIKTLTLLCITTLLLGLTACGATDNTTSGSAVTESDNQTNATSAPTEAPTEAPTAEPTEEPTPAPTPEPIIKLLKETSHNADRGIISQYIYEYDSNGNLIKKSRVDKSGILKSYELYEYNAAGQQTLYGSYFADGAEIRRKETVYNDQGIEIKYTAYDSNGNISTQFTYNDNGDLIEAFFYLSDGTLDEHNTYTYDEGGRLIRIDNVNPDFSSFETYSYDEDASGNVTKDYFNSDGILYRKEEFDTDGNLLKSSSCNPDSTITGWTTYEYNADSKVLLSSIYDKDGNFTGGSKYTYDENGRILKETDLAKDGSDLSWMEYTYDDHGRLTRQFQNDIMDWGLLHINCSYEYDENGRPTKKIEYNSSDEIKSYIVYEYGDITAN